MLEIFFLLLCGHAMADFALQSRDMAKMKSRHTPFVWEGKTYLIWPYVLTAHSLIHGLMVYVMTHNEYLGIAETILHFGIDQLKIDGKINLHVDQLLHVICKGVYICVLLY